VEAKLKFTFICVKEGRKVGCNTKESRDEEEGVVNIGRGALR
jgi:hypothetical protein